MEGSNLYNDNHASKQKGKVEQQDAFNVSKLMVSKRKLLVGASSLAQFQEHNTLGQQEVDADVSEFKVLHRKVSAQTTSLTRSQAHSENKIQEGRGGISKFKVPKPNLLDETFVFQFQEGCGIGHPDAHDDVSMSNLEKSKLMAQTATSETEEIGQEEASKVPKISKKRQKSGNPIKGFDILGSSSNGCQEDSELTKSVKKYEALRHKCLILYEKNSSIKEELKRSERKVKKLKKQNLALLDKLVVLEGLADPSDIRSPNQ